MQEAMYYFGDSQNGTVKCALCPHGCHIQKGKTGICGVRLNSRSKLYSTNYGMVTGMHFDPIEKKPLYHFHPGSSILSVGTFGCNLQCVFCQNFHISHPANMEILNTKSVSLNRILKASLEYIDNCGIAYTYNEPIVWIEYMFDIAVPARQQGLKNAMVSNGYINRKPLEQLLDVMDAFNIDLKAYTNSFYNDICGGSLQPVKNTLQAIAKRGKHLEITNLVIPGLNDDTKVFGEMVKWIAGELGNDIPLHINRYFPSYRLQIHPTPTETLLRLRSLAMEMLNFVYIGNVSQGGDLSNTICPQCRKVVIERSGYSIELRGIDNLGNCIGCGRRIVVL